MSEYFIEVLNEPDFVDELERLDEEEARDDADDIIDESVESQEFEDAMANCNCEVSSPIDCEGGKEWSIDFDRSSSNKGEARISSILSCIKYGIVAINGESAQGFVSDIKSCSSAGSRYLEDMILLDLEVCHRK